MFIRKLSALHLVYVFSGALLLSMGLGHRAIAQTGQMTPEEQAAVQLVDEWFAAWNTKDSEKVASYLAPNVEFRSQMGSLICHGPGPIITRYKAIMSGGTVVSDVKAYAIEDRIVQPAGAALPSGWGVAVLSSRVDTLNARGRHVALLASGFFIIAHGKIQEFFEEPAQSLGGGGPLALAGLRAAPARPRPPRTCAGGL